MKKLFTSLIALAAVTSAGAYSVTQVTRITDIVDGETYAIEYCHPTAGSRVLQLNSSNQAVLTSTSDPTSLMQSDATTHWIFTKSADCTHTSSTYTSDNHTGSYYISQNGQYFTYSKGATTPATATTNTDANQLFDFIKFTTMDSKYSSLSEDDGYFAIMTGFSSGYPATVIFIKGSTGMFDQYGGKIQSFDVNTENSLYDNGDGYGDYFKIYRISLTTAEKLEQLKGIYKAKLTDGASFGATVDNSTYSDKIDAITASSEAELTTAETKMQTIVEEYQAALSKAIIDRFNGQYVILRNGRTDGETRYLNLTSDYVSYTTAIDGSNVWKMIVEADSNSDSGFSCALFNPWIGKYCDTEQTAVSTNITASDNAEGRIYFIPETTDGSAFSFRYPSCSDTSHNYLYNYRSQNALLWNSGTGSSYHIWYLSFLTDDQKSSIYSTAKETVAALAGGRTFGTGLGQYTGSYAKKIQEFAQFTDESEFETVATAYREVTGAEDTSFTLNMPAKNSYLRIKGADGYVTADGDTHESTATAASIIWYSGETMVDYANGYAFNGEEFCDAADVTSEENTAVNISFSEASNAVGTYIITPADGDAYNSDGLTLEEVTALPVALNGGVAAVCFPVDVTLPSDGKFYTCVCDGTNITVSKKKAGDVIAAGTAILISGDADVELPYTAGESTAAASTDNNISYNQLATKFTASDGTITYVPSAASAAKAPALRVADADGETVPSVTFAKITSGNLAANTPAINVSTNAVPSGTDAVESFSLTLDPEQTEDDTFSVVSVVTSIEEINAEAAAGQPIYDLQGRRVTATPTHGLFIFGNKIRRI